MEYLQKTNYFIGIFSFRIRLKPEILKKKKERSRMSALLLEIARIYVRVELGNKHDIKMNFFFSKESSFLLTS